MTTTFLRRLLPVSALALIVGVTAIGGALAAGSENAERQACAVTAASDGTKPASLSEAEIRGKLEAAGYTQVRSLGRERGCVEAKGLDKDGKRFEVYLHPTTGEIVSQR